MRLACNRDYTKKTCSRETIFNKDAKESLEFVVKLDKNV